VLAVISFTATDGALTLYMYRIGQMDKFNGQYIYRDGRDCLRRSTREYGTLAWFGGLFPRITFRFPQYGGALTYLYHRNPSSGFFGDWWNATNTMLFTTFLSHPMHRIFNDRAWD
jgi:hypothetical protein